MYPDWPQSTADLVPLPNCDGPKLEPFDFQGPQKLEFLEHVGEGLHAHVFKVKILEHVYALKIFRFIFDDEWQGPSDDSDTDNRVLMSTFYNYSEPFSAECRAFGRLQEAGHEELAIQCFGYLLLDEEHECAMMEQFSHLRNCFDGNGDLRSRFLGREGRPPPLRGVVKAFGQSDEPLRSRDAKRLLRDVVQLQQLGIIHIDVAHRQLITGKIADLSTAITIPHYVTTPELNPRITPKLIRAMEFETFQFSINDYWQFDDMVRIWNEEDESRKHQISVYAFPRGRGCQIQYNLRRRPSRERVYSLVDPRLYDWRTSVHAATETSGTRAASSEKQRGMITKTRQRLDARPPRWYYDCNSKIAADLKSRTCFSTALEWEFEASLIFPRWRNHFSILDL